MKVRSIVLFVVLTSCGTPQSQEVDPVNDAFEQSQAEIRAAVENIIEDARTADIEGLQSAHLQSSKFSKFGPRSFNRQDLSSTDSSEAAFFGSISDYQQIPNDLKIDVFGDVAVVTYHPAVSFVRDGTRIEVQGRQTFVFIRTKSGWKIAHEHGTVLLE